MLIKKIKNPSLYFQTTSQLICMVFYIFPKNYFSCVSAPDTKHELFTSESLVNAVASFIT